MNCVYNIEINDFLLILLGLVVYRWIGMEEVVVNLEGYGREFVILDVDIICMVGWFIS